MARVGKATERGMGESRDNYEYRCQTLTLMSLYALRSTRAGSSVRGCSYCDQRLPKPKLIDSLHPRH